MDLVIKTQERQEYSVDYVWKRDCSEEKGRGTQLQRATWGSGCRNVMLFLFILNLCFMLLRVCVREREGEREPLSCVLLFETPMDCSLPDSSVHGILQARILEWVAIPFSRGIFPTQGSNPHLLHCRQISGATREALFKAYSMLNRSNYKAITIRL